MTISTDVIADVPEGTLNPAAGLNAALLPLRSLAQATVSEMFVNAPPGSPGDGYSVIVGAGTGLFADQDDALARYVEEGAFWKFYPAGPEGASIVLNLEDLGIYVFDPSSSGGWQPYPVLASLQNAANDGAAASAGVAVGGRYRNGSVLMIRVA